MSSTAPVVTLRRGAAMPRLGLGTWPMGEAEAERVVADAIGAGYRLVDTAENYENERGVGAGVRASGLAREDVFVTTKFNERWHSAAGAAEACERSLERLGMDYVDLLLVHWPNPDQDRYVEAFEGLVAVHERGLARAIGTSNFKPAHLERVAAATGQAPDVNQIQLSPKTTRAAARTYHAEHGIVTQSWSPIGGQGENVLDDPAVAALAERYGRTPAQIVLRWHLDLGLTAVPKSSDAKRLRENFDVFDFSLSSEDVAALSALDQGESAAVDSDAFGH